MMCYFGEAPPGARCAEMLWGRLEEEHLGSQQWFRVETLEERTTTKLVGGRISLGLPNKSANKNRIAE